MGWAKEKDVLRYFRVLTGTEAFMRRVLVSGLFFAIMLILQIMIPFISFATLITVWTLLIFELCSMIMPSVPLSTPCDSTTTNTSGMCSVDMSASSLKVSEVWEFIMVAIFSLTAAYFLAKRIYSIQGLSLAIISSSMCALLLLYTLETFASSNLIQDLTAYPTTHIEKILSRFKQLFVKSRGFYLMGTFRNKLIGLPKEERYKHTLMGAPTGEGKSTSLIIPQLLIDAEAEGSAVVPDAKSPELFNLIAGRWLKHKKKVFLFDPWHPDTVGINFLPEADDEELQTIVEVLMQEKEEAIGKEDAFFKSRTKYLLKAVFKLVQTFNDNYCNMVTAYQVLENLSILQFFIDTAPEEVKTIFTDYVNLNKETKVNAITSLREKLEIFMDPNVQRAFSTSEFKLSMLFKEKEPCLLVLGAPVDKAVSGTRISSLIINMVVRMAFEEKRAEDLANQRGDKSFVPNNLYLYLDELRNLKITKLADLVSIARTTKTHVIGSVTDLGFLKYYKEDFSSLMGNFRTRIFMKGLDLDSATIVSKGLGEHKGMFYSSQGGSFNTNVDSEPLLTPDEVMNLDKDKLIIFNPQTPPFMIDKASIYNHRWLKKLAVAAPKNMRQYYYEWGVANEELKNVGLPVVGGEYDIATMRIGKTTFLNTQITIDASHKETGGGKFRKVEAAVGIEL